MAVSYDNTVRTSAGEIVQFTFGEDGLDPSFMEAKDGAVVCFSHVQDHVLHTVEGLVIIKASSLFNYFYSLSNDEPLNTIDSLSVYVKEYIAKQDKLLPKKFLEQVQQYLLDHVNKMKRYLERNVKCQKHHQSNR